MVELHYSDDFGVLAAALADQLADERAADPLARPVVVVPNHRVASYLKLDHARRHGIATNFDVQFLDSFLAAAVEHGGDRNVLTRDQLSWLVLRTLSDPDVLADAGLSEVAAYITHSGGGARVGGAGSEREQRCFQLAEYLARLFVEYGLHDPGLLRRWATEEPDSDCSNHERWQRQLWRDVCKLRSRIEDSDAPYATLAEHYETTPATDLRPPARATLIGFSYIPRGYLVMLGKIASSCELSVFQLNPCRQFWEDFDSSGLENPLLGAWGRPGQITTRLLNDLSDFDFNDRFSEEPTAPTALGRVRADILDRRTPQPDLERLDDDSVTVLACANPRRELEAVADSIWHMMRADDKLRFNDIAVLLCGQRRDLYQAHASSVLAAAHHIPHHHVELPLATDCRVPEAIEALLALPGSDFTRPDVLAVLTHPLVRSRFPDVSSDEWIRWCQDLGVLRGADREAHEGTYIQDDRFNWDQGLRRLALGSCMSTVGLPHSSVRIGGSDTVPLDVSQSQRASAATFIALCRSLIADAQFTAAARLPAAEWATVLDRWLTSYLLARDHREEQQLRRCRDAIAQLRNITLNAAKTGDGAAAAANDEPFGFAIAKRYMLSALSTLRTSRGEFLGEGVTVAPFGVLGPLPYRVVFAVGLTEGEFPNPTRPLSFDLRASWSIPEPRALDQYRFLELLLSARERLVLAYTDRHAQSGESQQPASPVLELLRLLKDSYLSADAAARLVRRLPHKPHLSSEPLPTHSPVAVTRRAAAVHVRRELEAHYRDERLPIPTPAEVEAALRAPGHESLRELVGLHRLDAVEATDPSGTLSITALRKFLEDPLQGWAQYALGLWRDDDSDIASTQLEPFEHTRLQSSVVLADTLAAAAQATAPSLPAMLAEFDRRADDLEQRSLAPTGPFATAERDRSRALLTSWWRQLETMGALAGSTRLGVGATREGGDVAQLLPAVPLDVRGHTIDLIGTAALWVPNPIGAVITSLKDRTPSREVLRGVLSHLLVAAADQLSTAQHGITILTGTTAKRYQFTVPSTAAAREYLAGIADELLHQPHAYRFPCDIAFKHWKTGEPLAGLLGKLDANANAPVWQPIRDMAGVRPPADPDSIYRRRYAPLLSNLVELDD